MKFNSIIQRSTYSTCPLFNRFQDLPDSNMHQQSQHQVHHITTQQQQPHTTQQSNNSQDLVNSCDLANLESLTCNDSDELLRQLTENTFELESFFSEFPTAEIKVVSVECIE